MMLKNYAQIVFQTSGKECWRLYNLNGNEFYPFTDYNFLNVHENNYYQREEQAIVIAKFLDYLEEVEYFKKYSEDQEHSSIILSNYKNILRQGYNSTDPILKNIAISLNFEPCNAKKWLEYLKVVDNFLIFSQTVLDKNKEEQNHKNRLIHSNLFHEQLFGNFWESKILVEQYSNLNYLKKNSQNFCPDIYVKKDYQNQKPNSFPALGIPQLLENTSCYRDMAIYSLMAGTGMSATEVLNLKKWQIDFEKQKINLNAEPTINENNSKFFDSFADVLLYDLSKIAKKDRINSALLYDLSNLKFKEHVQSFLNYDLENLKIKDAMSNILFYDLNNLKVPHKISDILLYDLSKIWKGKKDRAEKTSISQTPISYSKETKTFIPSSEMVSGNIENPETENEQVLFIPGLKQIFFEALKLYYQKEAKTDTSHEYIFQFLIDSKKGEPYHGISREGFIHIFQKTVKRASILNQNNKKEWTPNSLKNFYISYLVNYYPTMQNFGLPIETIKNITGHNTLSESKKYVLDTKKDLIAQCEYLNNRVAMPNDLKELNLILLEKYALILDKIKLEIS